MKTRYKILIGFAIFASIVGTFTDKSEERKPAEVIIPPVIEEKIEETPAEEPEEVDQPEVSPEQFFSDCIKMEDSYECVRCLDYPEGRGCLNVCKKEGRLDEELARYDSCIDELKTIDPELAATYEKLFSY